MVKEWLGVFPALGCVHDDRIKVLCLWLGCTVRLVVLVDVAIVVVVRIEYLPRCFQEMCLVGGILIAK